MDTITDTVLTQYITSITNTCIQFVSSCGDRYPYCMAEILTRERHHIFSFNIKIPVHSVLTRTV